MIDPRLAKPPRKEKAPRQYRSTLPVNTQRPNRVNVKRQKRNKLRAYGPPERRKFVRLLPCSACGAEGYSQNAHVHKINAGRGYKGDCEGVAPLCGPRYTLSGCHNLFDEHRDDFDKRFPWYVPEVIAAETERAYQAFMEAELGGDAA